METKVKELVEECTKKTDMHNYWNLVKWSFTNNFKELQNIPLFNEFDENELEQFIKICDNRLNEPPHSRAAGYSDKNKTAANS